jgi:hypothetical protein
MFCSIPCIQHGTPPWVVGRCLLPAPEDTLVMLRMTPGQGAEGGAGGDGPGVLRLNGTRRPRKRHPLGRNCRIG